MRVKSRLSVSLIQLLVNVFGNLAVMCMTIGLPVVNVHRALADMTTTKAVNVFPTPIHCPPGFFPKHGVCTKDIFINLHNVIHGSSRGSHGLSSGCFDAIKIAWEKFIEAKIRRQIVSWTIA